MLFRVSTPDIDYRFDLKRKVTIIRGDSGTGKSWLYQILLARDYDTRVSCELDVLALNNQEIANLSEWSKLIDNTVLVIDEHVRWAICGNLWDYLNKKNVWFVFITRDTKSIHADFSVKEVYDIHVSGKYRTLRQHYTACVNHKKNTELIITEDSNSGYEFFKRVRDNVVPMHGKDSAKSFLEEHYNNTTYVVDGAAFGRLYDPFYERASEGHIDMIIPESFEEMLLKSSLFRRLSNVAETVAHPEEHGANGTYAHWESFFDKFIVDVMEEAGSSYSKSILSYCFTDKCCKRGSVCALVKAQVEDKIADILTSNGLDYLLSNNMDISGIREKMPPYLASTATDEEVIAWYNDMKEQGLV